MRQEMQLEAAPVRTMSVKGVISAHTLLIAAMTKLSIPANILSTAAMTKLSTPADTMCGMSRTAVRPTGDETVASGSALDMNNG